MENMLERKMSKGAEWKYRLDRFATSGLSVNAFCRVEGISVANFYRWRKLLSETVNMSMQKTEFIDVGTLPLPATAKAAPQEEGAMATGTTGTFSIRLELGHGLILHIERR